MIYNVFKEGTAKLSLLGLGCMRFPKLYPDKDDIDCDKAQEIIEYAYAQGVNYFDTAYMYHGGMSERFLAHALAKYPRKSFYLADKLPVWMLEDEADIDRVFQEQPLRCNVDYFDFYLCHSLSADIFEKMKKAACTTKIGRIPA